METTELLFYCTGCGFFLKRWLWTMKKIKAGAETQQSTRFFSSMIFRRFIKA